MASPPAHVLVVDDDEPIAAALRRALEYEGLRVSVVTSAPNAGAIIDMIALWPNSLHIRVAITSPSLSA